jgi:hypothetical protein
MGGKVRFVTHSDLSDTDIKDALNRIGAVDRGRTEDPGTGRAPLSRVGRAAARPAGY